MLKHQNLGLQIEQILVMFAHFKFVDRISETQPQVSKHVFKLAV